MSSLRLLHARIIVSVTVATLAGAAPAHAQVRVDLIPFVGGYYALTNTGRADTLVPSVTERHENQPAVGATLLVRLSQTIGIEGSIAYTPSGTNIISTTDTNPSPAGSILFAGVRARFWVPRTNFFGLAGVGIVSRSGEAWKYARFTGLTSIAGVAGFGVQAEVSPKVRMDFKVEVQVYSFDPDGELTARSHYEAKIMPDLLATVGIPIKLMGR